MLLDKIKSDALKARKEKDIVARSLLVTLGAEASILGKNDGNRMSTDEEVLKVVQKFMKGIDETLTVRPNDTTAQREKELLQIYLPRQMTGSDLESVIESIAKNLDVEKLSMKDMGKIMGALNAQYAGAYDGKEASQLVRQKINQN